MTTTEITESEAKGARSVALVNAAAKARLVTDPASVTSAIIGDYLYRNADEDDHAGMMIAMDAKVEAVRSGDMSGLEAVLVGQVHALNAMFSDFAMRAAKSRGDHPQAFERYTRLGLKAQAQCRATIEAIAEMKNPPVVFARTANVAAGHQQNNYYGAEDGHAGNHDSAGQPHAATTAERTRECSALPGQDTLRKSVPSPGDAQRQM